MHHLLFSVCKLSFFLVFVISLPFLINADFVLKMWLGTVPEHTTLFFILLLIYAYVDIFAYPLDIAAQATGKMKKYSIIISIIVLSSLPLAYIAYLFGAIPESIYIISIIMAWTGLVARVTLLSNLISFKPVTFFNIIVYKIVLVAALSLIVPLLFKYIIRENIYTIIAGFVITYIVTIIIVYQIGLEIKEKQFLLSYVIKYV